MMRRTFSWVVLVTGFAFGALACGGGPMDVCTTFRNDCPRGGTLTSCCTNTQCHYRASDGSDFPCNGLDCSQANVQANAWCQAH